MNKIIFDLDGVLRDLVSYMEKKYDVIYTDYWQKVNNKTFTELIEEDLSSLILSKPCEYLTKEIARYIYEIWTFQPKNWINLSQMWIEHYITPMIGRYPVVRYLKPKEKIFYLNADSRTILIEDSPEVPQHGRIFLIDRPYNKDNKNIRIYNPDDLLNRLKIHGKEQYA